MCTHAGIYICMYIQLIYILGIRYSDYYTANKRLRMESNNVVLLSFDSYCSKRNASGLTDPQSGVHSCHSYWRILHQMVYPTLGLHMITDHAIHRD